MVSFCSSNSTTLILKSYSDAGYSIGFISGLPNPAQIIIPNPDTKSKMLEAWNIQSFQSVERHKNISIKLATNRQKKIISSVILVLLFYVKVFTTFMTVVDEDRCL